MAHHYQMNNFDAGVDLHCRAYLAANGKSQSEIDSLLATHGAAILSEAQIAWDTAATSRAEVLVQRNWHDTKVAIEAWIDANLLP